MAKRYSIPEQGFTPEVRGKMHLPPQVRIIETGKREMQPKYPAPSCTPAKARRPLLWDMLD
jgi:hypothetical protein